MKLFQAAHLQMPPPEKKVTTEKVQKTSLKFFGNCHFGLSQVMAKIKIKETHRNDGCYGKFLTGGENEENRMAFFFKRN